jgi:hypothetical protein
MTQHTLSRVLGRSFSIAACAGLVLIAKLEVLLNPVATLFVLIYVALVPGVYRRRLKEPNANRPFLALGTSVRRNRLRNRADWDRDFRRRDQPGVDGLLCFADSRRASRLPRAQAYPTPGEQPDDGGFLIYKSATSFFRPFRYTGRIREQPTHDSGGTSGCRSVSRA